MGRFVVFISLLAFSNIVCAMPAWDNEDDAEFSPSSLEITRRRCSCSNHHHQCGCCLRVKEHASHKSIEADVCMNSSFVPSPLAVEFFMLWNKHKVFNHTISDTHPRPICFDIPKLRHGKACVKFFKMSIKKDHTGGCVALEFKTKHRGKDIPLGCFFFRGGEGRGLDMGTFLDSESLMSLLEDLFQASMGNQIETTRWLANPQYKEKLDDDVTDVVTVDKASCQCSKSPPQCDCCAQFKIFGLHVKVCVHGDVDPSGQGFDVAVTINGLTVFKKHITVPDPPPICHSFHIAHFKADVCLKLTNVSLKPGHAGACLELDIKSIKSIKLPLGCFYLAASYGEIQ